MQTSERGVAFIAAHEGVVTRAYKDAAGVWTIGVGHTAAAGPPVPVAGMTISRDEAYTILACDLPKYERRVVSSLPGLAQPAFDGAVSFDFNTGAIHRASWVAALKAGDVSRARAGLMQWVKAGGRTLAGLVRRREAEAALIFDGDYGAAVAVPAPSEAVRAWQADLATLGFYRGAIDGIAGPATRAAVLAYQASHPDLVADGIVGPATRASLSRDVALRRRVAESAGAAVGGAVAAGTAAAAGGGSWIVVAGVAGIAIVVIAAVILMRRYRGEVVRLISHSRKGH